jgi:hypothetical protein
MHPRIPRQSSPPSPARNRKRPALRSQQPFAQGQRRGEPPSSQLPAVPLLPVALGPYPFSEITTRWKTLPHGAGIVALLHQPANPGQSYQLFFLDEADDVHDALAQLHTRALLSVAEENGMVVYAVLYTELVAAARRQIVAELRTDSHLPTALSPSSLPPAPHRTSPVRSRWSRK